jgi:phage terminase small subunit
MPKKGGKFTPQERTFVKHMAETGDKTYSATKAGYKTPEVVGHIVAAKPAIRAEIVHAQQEKLFNELLPLAVRVHAEILSDIKTPAGARVQAVKLVYDRTLGLDEALKGKEPHEMTPEELAKAIDALERVAAERARQVVPIVDVEPETIDDEQVDKGVFD